MPRPAIPEPIVDVILEIWAYENCCNATRVFALAKAKLGDKRPSLRKIQQIISAAKPKAKTVPPDRPIEPWGEDWPKTPNEIAFLFRLMYFAYGVNAPKLDRRVAKWALRLKSIFDGGDPIAINYLYSWANLYARRERASLILGEAVPSTADIDAQMVFRVWEQLEDSNNLSFYQKAVEEGAYPEAKDSFEDLKVLFPGGSVRTIAFRAGKPD